MSTSSIPATNHHPLPHFPNQKKEVSKTDTKIYATVVLSYLLIAIGIALACTMPYLLNVIHPMIAATTSSLPLALGIFGFSGLEQPNSSFPAAQQNIRNSSSKLRKPPIGLSRTGHNCWINAAMQLLFHCYKDQIEDFKNNKPVEDPSKYVKLFPFINIYDIMKGERERGTKQTSSADTQTIRTWLSTHDHSIDARTQDDPSKLIDFVLKEIQASFPQIEETITFTKTQGDFFREDETKSQSIETVIPFHSSNIKIMQDGINLFFNSEEKNTFKQQETNESTDTVTNTRRKFCSVPNHLLVYHALGDNDDPNFSNPMENSLNIHLDESQCGENTNYQCDGFIRHYGTLSSGHYIAYIKIDNTWYEADDSSILPISDEKAKEHSKWGSIYHYRRSDAHS